MKSKSSQLIKFFTLLIILFFSNSMSIYAETIAVVSLESSAITVNTKGNNASIVIKRTGDTSESTTVYYRTLNGSGLSGIHYINKQDSVTFAAGEISKTINISTLNFSTWEKENRFFFVELYKVGVADNAVIDKSKAISRITINHLDSIADNGINYWYNLYEDPNKHHYENNSTYYTPVLSMDNYNYWKSIGSAITAKFKVSVNTYATDVNLHIRASNNEDGSNSTGKYTNYPSKDGWLESGNLRVENYKYIYGKADVLNAEGPLGDDADIDYGRVQIYVTDTTHPTISSFHVVGNTAEPYSDGDDLYISVRFSEIVTVSGGTPKLPIKFSDDSVLNANYIGGSGTDVLVFKLTIPSGKSSEGLYLLGTDSFIGESYVKDLANNSMNPYINENFINSGIKIQNTIPTITDIIPDKNDVSLKADNTVDFTLVLSEPVTITGTTLLNLNNGASAVLNSVTGNRALSAVFRYTIGSSGNEDISHLAVSSMTGGTIVDYSGNALIRDIPNGTTNIRVDTTQPVVSLSINTGVTYEKSYSPIIIVTDTNGSGIKEIRYVWNNSSSTPSDASFTLIGGNNLPAPISGETGNRYLHIRAEDVAGNVTYYNSGEFKLDNEAPLINLTKDSGSVAKAHSTIINVSDFESGVSGSFKYIWSTSSTLPEDIQFDSANTGVVGSEITRDIGDGIYYLHIRADDKAGNRNYKTSNSFIFDNSAPAAEDITVNNKNSSGDTVTNESYQKSYTVTISAKDSNGTYADGRISNIKYQWKDITTQIDYNDDEWLKYNGDFLYDNSLITGEKYLHIIITDEAGNEGYMIFKYTFDHNAPYIEVKSHHLSGVYKEIMAEINVTDNHNELDVFKYVWLPYSDDNYDGVNWINGSITGYTGYTGKNSVTKNDVSGIFYLHIYAKDNVGNNRYLVSGPYTVDAEAPTGTINIIETVVGNGSITLKLSAVDNTISNKVYYALSQDEGNTWSNWTEYTKEKPEIAITYEVENLQNGIKRISAKFKDELGNISEVYSDTVTVDLIQPTAQIAYSPTKEEGWTNKDVIATLVNISDNLTEEGEIETPNGKQHAFIDNMSYEFTIEDAVGNKTTLAAAVDWIDKIFPEITSIAGNQIPQKEHSVVINASDNVTIQSVSYQWTNTYTAPDEDDGNWINVENGSKVTQRGKDGEWYLHVKAVDEAGNITIITSGKFIFDNTSPTGNINIVESYVKNNSVTLNFSAEDTDSNFADIMYSLSKDGVNWDEWQSLNSSNITINNYNIIDEEGIITEYVKYKDKAGNESQVYSDTVILDKQGPTGELKYSSNKEDGYINGSVTVELINLSDNYTDTENILVSEKTYVFSSNENHTFMLKDEAGNVSKLIAEVDWIDRLEPEITLSPNSNQTPLNEHNVSVGVTDNLTSEENIIISYQWTQNQTSPSEDDLNWLLVNNNSQVQIDQGDGEWYLHIKAYDEAGNFKIFSSGKFILDNAGPTGSIDIRESITNLNAVTLNLSGDDEVSSSANIKYSLSLDGSVWSDWCNLSEILNNYPIPNVEGTTTIYVKYKDELDNESEIYSDTVILDLTKPSAEVIYSDNKEDGYVNTDITALLINIEDNYTESENIEINEVSHTFTTNGEATFILTDAAGNTKTITAKVDWIDKYGPVINPISGNQNPKKAHRVLINAADNVTTSSAISMNYQWTTDDTMPPEDDLGWISTDNNSTVIKSDADGKWYIHVKAKDEAGNISYLSSDKFVLDNTAPEGMVNYSTLNRTAQPVIATLVTDETVTITNTVEGSNKYTFNDNGTFTFEFEDLAGNQNSAIAEVNWIDKTIPTADVTLSTTEWTNENIEIVVSVTTGSSIEIGEFQFDGIDDYTLIKEKTKERELSVGGKLNNYIYETAYSVGDNGKIIFAIKDVVTEISHDIEVTIDSIDKIDPTYKVTYSEVKPTQNDVQVGIITQDNSNLSVEIIKPEEATLIDGNYVFSENGDYDFTIRDRAGNTVIVPVQISNIDKIPPELSLSYSETDWTNNNVTAAVSADEAITILNNNGSASYEFLSNGVFEFEVQDAAGNTSKITAAVDYIDRVYPEAEIQYNPVNVVNTEVVIKVLPSEEVSIVSLNELDLVEGSTNKFIVETNGSYEFKLIDRAGNETIKKIIINNIDKESPIITYTLSTVEPTNKELEIYLHGNEFFEVISVPEGITQKGTENDIRYYANENGVYDFVVSDLGGNEGYCIVEITNIDKEAPTLSLSYSTEEWTNKDVTAAVSADEDITVLNNDGNFNRTFTTNGEFEFQVEDKAGNISEIVAMVSNIDKESPNTSMDYSPIGIVNTDVIITVEPDEIATIESMEGLELQEGSTNKFIVETNGEYTFVIRDRAGNESIESITISTIDKESPIINYSLSTEDLTNNDVQIYFNSDEAYEVIYVPEGIREEVIYGNKRYYAIENGNYTFKVKDTAGNEEEITVDIANIDKAAPILNIEYSTIETTNKPVTATLTADEDIVVLNNNGSRSYEFLQNGEIVFYAKDIVGNEASITAKVNNIDAAAPMASITYSTTAMTNEPVIVTVTANELLKSIVFEEDIEVITEDSADEFITKEFKVIENGIYHFVITDLAGNFKNYTINITNIDKISPVINYTLVYDTPTGIKEVNQDGEIIRVSNLESGDNQEKYEKSLLTKNPIILNFNINETYEMINVPDNVTLNKEGKYEIVDNDTYNFKAKDLAGNTTGSSIMIDTIDKVKPEVIVTYSTLEPTKDDVIAEVKSINGEYIRVVNNYNRAAKMFTSNGEYTFIVQDYAGNQVNVTASVNNIDRTPPELSVEYSTVEMTNENVIIEIKANEEFNMVNNGGSKFYTFEKNGSIRLTAEDLIGNRSEIIVTVNNIDKTAPNIVFTGKEKMVILQGQSFDLLEDVTTISYEDKSLPIIVNSKVDNDVPGKYTVTYSVTDKAGNSSTREREIEVLSKDKFIMTFNGINVNEVEYLKGTHFKLDSYNTKGKYTILYCKGKVKAGEMKIKGIEIMDNEFSIEESGWYSFLIIDQERNTSFYNVFIIDNDI